MTQNGPQHRPWHHGTRPKTPHTTGHHNQRCGVGVKLTCTGRDRPGRNTPQRNRTKKKRMAPGGGGGWAPQHAHHHGAKDNTKATNTTDTNTRRDSTTRLGATPQAKHSTRGQQQTLSTAEQGQTTKHTSRAPGAAAALGEDGEHRSCQHGATRHRTRQQATTQHREQAQPGCTKQHSASANRPPPGHNIDSNRHQQNGQSRTGKPPKHLSRTSQQDATPGKASGIKKQQQKKTTQEKAAR